MDGTVRAGSSVLVVDDEPRVMWVLRFSLEYEGYATLSARDGLEALDQIRAHRPAAVVLDVMMPRMDGWAVMEELAKLPGHERPRVVMVSAVSSAGDRRRAAELGAVAFVPKPFDMEELLAILQGRGPAS